MNPQKREISDREGSVKSTAQGSCLNREQAKGMQFLELKSYSPPQEIPTGMGSATNPPARQEGLAAFRN